VKEREPVGLMWSQLRKWVLALKRFKNFINHSLNASRTTTDDLIHPFKIYSSIFA
jgi:hypothetical protein